MLMRTWVTKIAVACVACGISGAVHSDVPANAALRRFNSQFDRPTLLEVAPGIRVAFSYSYSNFVFIEGRTGVIVVDTGWFEESMHHALEDLRRATRKPVIAMVLTHNHEDHKGGGGLVVAEAQGEIPIYGPAGFARQSSYDDGPLRRIVQERNFAQTGLLLPEAGYAVFGASVGPVNLPGQRHVVMPNIEVSRRTALTIDGVNLELIPGGADIPESLMVWLPKQRVLLAADALGGVFPWIETPRYEPNRDPRLTAATLSIALSLEPDVVVPGHGRIITGRSEAQSVLAANRDVILFTVDQVERMLLLGYSAEQIVHLFQLPAELRAHQDLQPFYHRVEWVLRGLISKRLGFFTELLDLIRLDGVEEAKRFVGLLGGVDRVATLAREALVAGDERWAARLCNLSHLVDPGNPRTKAILVEALKQIAVKTNSVNERHYVLTAVGQLEGKIDLESAISAIMLKYAASLSDADLIKSLSTRLNVQILPNDARFDVVIQVGDDPLQHHVHVERRVLRYIGTSGPADITLGIQRALLEKLYAGIEAWSDALRSGQIAVRGEMRTAELFASAIDDYSATRSLTSVGESAASNSFNLHARGAKLGSEARSCTRGFGWNVYCPEVIELLELGKGGPKRSYRSISGGTAVHSAFGSSRTDETTETQPRSGLQGASGAGGHPR